MIYLHASMEYGLDQARDPWMCSQTGYQLRCGAQLKYILSFGPTKSLKRMILKGKF